MQAHASMDCAGCDWERQPQAFRWFPELGPPLDSRPAPARAPRGEVAMAMAKAGGRGAATGAVRSG